LLRIELSLLLSPSSRRIKIKIKGKVLEDGVGVDEWPSKVEISWTQKNLFTTNLRKFSEGIKT
jgi:hypothetical protein